VRVYFFEKNNSDTPKFKRHVMKRILFLTVLLGLFGNTAYAADCATDKKISDLTQEETNTLYECFRAKLVADYQSGDNEYAKEYTSWKAVSSGPAKPGVHSNRYLMTFVNSVGVDAYTEFKTSGVNLPIGTVIAKESFKIKKKGKVKAGPLFFMEKVGVDKAPKTGGWLYSGVKGNGKKFSVSQKFCDSCHKNYKEQDYVGYPVESVRVTN
jgi:hypothetical protein